MSDKSRQFPPRFIDALLAYASDPTQWPKLAEVLDSQSGSLQDIDPSAFLTLLSQAETLAWQLRNETVADLTGCDYYLFDNQRELIQPKASEGAAQAQLPPGISEANLAAAWNEIDAGAHHALVEVSAENATSFAYLALSEHLPSTLAGQQDVHAGLLVARNLPADQIRRVMQSSFNLTAAEVAVCLRLSYGNQLKDVADQLHISTNTARNHLQAVFDKTGLNRQSDLILMMTQLSVVLAVVSQAQYADQSPSVGKNETYPRHQFAILGGQQRPRRLAYRVYGFGERTIIYFHESGGTSQLLPETAQLAERFNLQIIAIERPGSGFSDPLENYSFHHVANDTAELLDQLGISQVSLIGFLAGASYALATASLLGDRVDEVLLVAGRGPASFLEEETSALGVLRHQLMSQPWLLSTFFNILRSRANENTNRRALMQVYGSNQHDKALLESRADILRHMISYTLESLTISGAGLIGEIRCFSQPAVIDLEAITAAVTVWHGDADTVASYKSLADKLGDFPYKPRIFPNHGSLLIYEHWPEVLAFFEQTE